MGKSRKRRKAKEKPEEKAGGRPVEGEDAGPDVEETEDAGGLHFAVLLLAEVAVSAVVLVALLFLVRWPAAASIAGAVFVFLDAAMNRIYRVKPSSDESRSALVFWSVVGFVPFAGVIAYLVMRRKLAQAPDDMETAEGVVEIAKRRIRAIPVPAAIVVALIALGIALATLRPPERFALEFGTDITRGLRIEGARRGNTFSVGRITVKLQSDEPMEGVTNLDWKLFLLGSGGQLIDSGTVRVHPESSGTIWAWRVGVRLPGAYRLDVVDHSGAVVKSGRFHAVSGGR